MDGARGVWNFIVFGFMFFGIIKSVDIVTRWIWGHFERKPAASNSSSESVTVDGPPTPKDFYDALGKFHALWQALDVIIDFAIGDLQGLHEQAILANNRGRAIPFGKKLRQLKKTVENVDHRNKVLIVRAIDQLNKTYRAEITHSYFASSNDQVRFVYNGNPDGAKPCSLTFTGQEFISHVGFVAHSMQSLQKALDLDAARLGRFTELALSSNPPV